MNADIEPPTANVVPPYARMIPGNSIVSFPHRERNAPSFGSAHHCETIPSTKSSRFRFEREWLHWLVPHSVPDPSVLYWAVLLDLLVVVASCGVLDLSSHLWSAPPILIPTYAVLVTLFNFTEGLYNSCFEPLSARVVAAQGRATLLAAVLIFFASGGNMLVRAIFSTCASSIVSLMLMRLLKHCLEQRLSFKAAKRNALIVGAGSIGRSIARTLRNQHSDDTVVCGFLDDDLPLSPTILGRIDDLEWLARAEFIDEVILALPDQPKRTREAAEIALRNHLDLRAVPDLPSVCWPGAATDRIGEVPVVTLHRESLPSASLFMKRLLDMLAATFGLLLLSPLMAAIALLIRLDSPGPLFYAAERTGAKGHRFLCFKFRSMIIDSDRMKADLRQRNQREGPTFKIEDDPRITRVGRFLRCYSLDELPQLWNVLRGDMSLVGPRPHPIDDVNRYELHHYRRLDVKPGITGLWQITARKNPSFELNMHLDLTYIENWSLLLDLRILARTARVLFAPEGA